MEILVHPNCKHLRRHISFYRAIGPGGMSSGEEIDTAPNRPRRVRTFRKHFLSKRVTALNHHLDEAYSEHIRPLPYERITSKEVHTSIPIPGLAIDAYPRTWLCSLTDEEFAFLNPRKRPHDFSF